MKGLRIRGLTKSFNDQEKKVLIFNNLSLNVEPGSFVSIFGPNGCGKTTLLNMIAGLTEYNRGELSIAGKKTSTARIGFVFQKYGQSLLPWLRNIDNIGISLNGIKRQECYQCIKDFVQYLDIGHIPLYDYPYQCSGGQQQLIVIIRELINKPDLLLMDEPFSSLDYEKKLNMMDKLLHIWRKTKTTLVFVSHDIDEAIYLSDQVILLSKTPTKIVDIFNIDCPRPRSIDFLERQEFFNYKKNILENFIKITKNNKCV
jgi:NitT/TauT family transport system ATP-binding protein